MLSSLATLRSLPGVLLHVGTSSPSRRATFKRLFDTIRRAGESVKVVDVSELEVED